MPMKISAELKFNEDCYLDSRSENDPRGYITCVCSCEQIRECVCVFLKRATTLCAISRSSDLLN